MAGQPLDGSWAQARQQPPPQEQAQAYEQAAYQSYPPRQQYAPGANGGYQEAAYEGQQAAYEGQETYQPPRQGFRQAPRSKGFVASLFDFSFSSFVTPKLIRFLYVLATLWVTVLTLAYCGFCLHFADSFATVVFLVITAPIVFLLGLGSIRVGLEFFMVLHRINENIQAIRDHDDMS